MECKIKNFTIGVVVPTFITSDSGLQRLRETLTSISNQTHSPEEIVITDDSPAEFSKCIKFLIKEFSELKILFVLNHGQKGVSPNSNLGINCLTTLFVHCLHQDDSIIDVNCYRKIKERFESDKINWFLLGGIVGNLKIKPSLRGGRLPSELCLGINTIGGPSAAVFLRSSQVEFDPNFTMLCDIKFFIDVFEVLGAPEILNSPVIRYGVGEWQLQRRIEEEEIYAELLELNSQDIKRARAGFRQVIKYSKRYDVKERSLRILFELTHNPLYFSTLLLLRIIRVSKMVLRFKSVHKHI